MRRDASVHLEDWSRLDDVTAGIFSTFLAELRRQEEADPEPEERFSAPWDAWQKRHWERAAFRTQLSEAEALTIDEGEPAPLAREGLAAFLDWSKRQDSRRRCRRPAARRP